MVIREACEVVVRGSEDLPRLDLELLFLPGDERDYIVDNVHTADAGIARS